MPAVGMAANTSQINRPYSTCPTNEEAPQVRILGPISLKGPIWEITKRE